MNVRVKSNKPKVWLTFWFLRRVTVVTTVTKSGKLLDATEAWVSWILEMWWILEAGIQLTLWNLWNQWISSLRRYRKKIFLYLISHWQRRDSRQADPLSYRFPDGTTMVKTEDGFSVCLGSLLDGWDVCKATRLRTLVCHVVKVLRIFRIWRLEKVPWSVKDTGRQFGLLSQHYPIQGRLARQSFIRTLFYIRTLLRLFSLSNFLLQKSNCLYRFNLSTYFVQTTCRPIVKLFRRLRLFLRLVTLPFVHLQFNFNHLLQCFQPLQISWWYTFDKACCILVDFNLSIARKPLIYVTIQWMLDSMRGVTRMSMWSKRVIIRSKYVYFFKKSSSSYAETLISGILCSLFTNLCLIDESLWLTRQTDCHLPTRDSLLRSAHILQNRWRPRRKTQKMFNSNQSQWSQPSLPI